MTLIALLDSIGILLIKIVRLAFLIVLNVLILVGVYLAIWHTIFHLVINHAINVHKIAFHALIPILAIYALAVII